MGSVYVIETSAGCKIGSSKNPEKRIKSLLATSPIDFDRVYISDPCLNYIVNEKALHRIFADSRTKNEWFSEKYETIVAEERKLSHRKKRYVIERAGGGDSEVMLLSLVRKSDGSLVSRIEQASFEVADFKHGLYEMAQNVFHLEVDLVLKNEKE